MTAAAFFSADKCWLEAAVGGAVSGAYQRQRQPRRRRMMICEQDGMDCWLEAAVGGAVSGAYQRQPRRRWMMICEQDGVDCFG